MEQRIWRFFLTLKNKLVFLEVGARIPGSFVVPVYEKTFEVNLLDHDFCIQLNQQGPEVVKDLNPAFWCRVPKQFWKVKRIHPVNLSSQYDIQWNVKLGDMMSSADSILFSAADLLVYDKDYGMLLQDFEFLRNHVPFEQDKNVA